MSPNEESCFRDAFRKAVSRLPNKDTPLVPGGLSPAQYADALDNPQDPNGRLLVKMADALSGNPAAHNHGYHQVVQLMTWMAKI